LRALRALLTADALADAHSLNVTANQCPARVRHAGERRRRIRLADPFAGPFTPVNIRSQGLSALVIAVYGTFLAYHGIRSASPQRDRHRHDRAEFPYEHVVLP
jgi:hypothetical protein